MAMSLEVDAQYERILSLMPPAERRESCSGVVQCELTELHHVVSEVTWALSRLQEVRRAVTKLTKKPTAHSSSLVEVMDSTLLLQREMQLKIAQLPSLRRKRRRPQGADKGNTIASRVVQEDETESESNTSNNEEFDSESETDSESEEECKSGNCAAKKHQDNRNITAKSATKATVLNVVSSSSDSSSESDSEEESGGDTGRSLMLNPLAPEVREKNSAALDGNTIDTRGNLRLSKTYAQMMEQLDGMPVQERNEHAAEVLEALTELLDQYGFIQLQESHATVIMKLVAKWAAQRNGAKNLVGAFHKFSSAMTAFIRQLPHGFDKIQLKSLNSKLFNLLSVRNTSPLSDLAENGVAEDIYSFAQLPSAAICGINQKRTEQRANARSVSTKACLPPQVRATSAMNRQRAEQERLRNEAEANQTVTMSRTCNELTSDGKNCVKVAPLQSDATCMPQIIQALEELIEDDDSGRYQWKVIYAAREIIAWVESGMDICTYSDMYCHLADTLASYANDHPTSDQLVTIAEEFYCVVYNEPPTNAVPSNSEENVNGKIDSGDIPIKSSNLLDTESISSDSEDDDDIGGVEAAWKAIGCRQ